MINAKTIDALKRTLSLFYVTVSPLSDAGLPVAKPVRLAIAVTRFFIQALPSGRGMDGATIFWIYFTREHPEIADEVLASINDPEIMDRMQELAEAATQLYTDKG